MSSPQPTVKNSLARRWAARITITGLSLLVILAGVAYVTIWMGHVQGSEINNDTFQRRSFSYFQLPMVELQVTGIIRHDTTGDLEKHLIKQKLITVVKPTTPPNESLRWDLVTAGRLNIVTSRGEAEILSHYLDATDADGDIVWLKWSKEHPKLAKVLWPSVLDVAKQELYILVPELFDLAGRAEDPVVLQNQLDALMSEQYLRVATIQQQLERHELAVELFTNSLDHAPDTITALERRAVSLVALGNQEKADADLAQVQELQRF